MNITMLSTTAINVHSYCFTNNTHLPFYSLHVTCCTKKPNISTTVRSAHTVFMCFLFIWEQTASCATYSINWLVFITEMKSVYSAVRTGSVNKAVCASCLKGFLRTVTCATYSINWLVFITEMKSVYSAVRTGSLNKAVCVSSIKG